MTPTDLRELLRIAILKVLDATPSKYGLGVTSLQHLLSTYNHHPTADELQIQMRYLESKGLIEPINKKVSAEAYAWQITGEGSDYVAMHE